MDLGECPNIHDLALRADYELAAKKKDYFYDIDVSIYLAETLMMLVSKFVQIRKQGPPLSSVSSGMLGKHICQS